MDQNHSGSLLRITESELQGWGPRSLYFYKHPKGFSHGHPGNLPALFREHENAPAWEDWTSRATTANSLGPEVISSQPGIVYLQEDISIVHSGREDLQMERTQVVGQTDITSQTSLQPETSGLLSYSHPSLPFSQSLCHNSLKEKSQWSSSDPGLC